MAKFRIILLCTATHALYTTLSEIG